MNGINEASDWMDIERFSSASETDGLLWAENLRIAASPNVREFQELRKSPRWLSWDDISNNEVVLRKIIKLTPREQQTVGILQAASVIEAVGMFEQGYADEAEMWQSREFYAPIDEVSPALDAIASVNLHAPDSVILEDFKKWLTATREAFEMDSFDKNRSDRLAVMKENQVLPYIWMQSWLNTCGHTLTQAQQAKILFPDSDQRYFDIDVVEKLRKRTKLLATEYFTTNSDGSIVANMNKIYSLRFFRSGGNV